ncbi:MULTISPECIES: hypothetical protein [Rhodococcus]|nr:MULTISPECIES: hypothetical protein [Rhodococcus]QQZ18358.1 hypothetical protein GO592_39860 [Rhodococcus sp. 21391]UOT08298.1 hypothetical protein MPY17_38990 [Rhodococcus opacus]
MTTAPDPFATLTMDGEQFEDGRLPVRALAELQRYVAIVLRAAELKWLDANPGKELPEDFHDSFELTIAEVRPGSATSVLERPQTSVYDSYYEEGRLDFEAALNEVLNDQSPDLWHPLVATEEFGEFGSSLDDGEFMSVPVANDSNSSLRVTPSSYQNKIRTAHKAATSVSLPPTLAIERRKESGWVVARLVALNGLESKFTLLLDGREVNGKFKEPEIFDDMKAVLGTSEKSPVVRIFGRLSFVGEDISRILEATKVQVLEVDGEPWSGRFIELAQLSEGWNDEARSSEAVAFSAIDGAREILRHVAKIGREIPGIYPSEDGGVSLEWASPQRVITIEVSPDGVYEMNRYSRDGESSAVEPTENLDGVKKFIDDTDVEAVRG